MRTLFDKKVFMSLLIELENLRKILNVKKCFYIFNLPYEGKSSQTSEHYSRVEERTTTTLRFLNMARLLKIIGYDPGQYMNAQSLEIARHGRIENKKSFEPADFKQDQDKPSSIRQAAIQNGSRQNLGFNLVHTLSKYTAAGSFLRELTETLKNVNNNDIF